MNDLTSTTLKVLTGVVAILAPIHTVIATVFALLLADMITGMWAAHKRGEKISSAAMRRTVSKIIIYEMVIVLGYFVETQLLADFVPLVKIVSGLIASVEFVSLLENANHILGYNMFKELILKLGSPNDPENKK